MQSGTAKQRFEVPNASVRKACLDFVRAMREIYSQLGNHQSGSSPRIQIVNLSSLLLILVVWVSSRTEFLPSPSIASDFSQILAQQNRAGGFWKQNYPNRCIPAILMPMKYGNPGDFWIWPKTEASSWLGIGVIFGTRIQLEFGILPLNKILGSPPRWTPY